MLELKTGKRGAIRTVAEYVGKVAEFKRQAQHESDHGLKKRYAELADRYQLMADERRRMISDGQL